MKIEINKLVTFTIFAKIYPNKGGKRGVKQSYLYKLSGEKTSEKTRVTFTIITICGMRFIYLNEYTLNLLKLSLKETQELISKEIDKDNKKEHSRKKILPILTEEKTINNNNDIFLE